MITKESIENFFNDACAETEAEEVQQYLAANPDALHYLEKEWDEFKVEEVLPSEVSRNLWYQIQQRIHSSGSVNIFFYKIAIAAIVLFMLAAGWYFHLDKGETNNYVDSRINRARKISNTSNKKISVTLTDSSVVELMANSSLDVLDGYGYSKREVILHGEAFFSVVKDTIRPFSVISDSIITTVIGTKFTIKAHSADKHIKIILHQGRVSVNRSHGFFRNKKSTFELLPGDIFIYNRKTKEGFLNEVNPGKIRGVFINSLPKGLVKGKDGETLNSDNWYMFNNQPLSEVLDHLSVLYKTTILYNKNELKNRSFIGKVDKTDSLQNILQSIGLLNNIKVSKIPNGYAIKK